MSIRWRKTGELLCGAKSEEMDGDTYIGDHLHYELSIIQKCLVPDVNEHENGLWYWLYENKDAKNQPGCFTQTRD